MSTWTRWFPGLRSLAGYERAWLLRDLAAGLALAAVCVPAGMAYAELAGLAPVYGLYATIPPLLVYVLFGPSRVIAMGPDSAVAPLVAATIVPMALADPSRRVALAGMLAVLVGVMALVVGAGHLGFITDLLSKPVRLGYMTGLAVVVVVSQLPKLFGFSTTAESVHERLWTFAKGIGSTNAIAVAAGVCSLVVILLLGRFLPRIPGAIVVVVGATLASWLLHWSAAGVPTVGVLPSGLPGFRLPLVGLQDTLALVAGAAGIAVMTLTDTSVMSQSFATARGEAVASDDEFVALGVANVSAGLFQGFPVSGSASRSAANAAAGARSQLSGAFAALALCALLALAPWLLGSLPLSVLGAIIVAAGFEMADAGGMMRLFHLRRTEFWLSFISFAGVVALGVLPGVFLAVGLSMLNFIRRQWWPHDAVLGRAPGVKGYHDIGDFTDAQQVPGLLLYRFDAPLFFANAGIFRRRLLASMASQPHPVRRVIIAAEPLIDVDTTAADTLSALVGELHARNIGFGFAELKHPVREHLEDYGIIEIVGEEMLFPTIGSAVHGYLSDSGVEWIDWEDELPAETPDADVEAGQREPEF